MNSVLYILFNPVYNAARSQRLLRSKNILDSSVHVFGKRDFLSGWRSSEKSDFARDTWKQSKHCHARSAKRKFTRCRRSFFLISSTKASGKGSVSFVFFQFINPIAPHKPSSIIWPSISWLYFTLLGQTSLPRLIFNLENIYYFPSCSSGPISLLRSFTSC